MRASSDAPLHTETVGSVIDRLAIAWIRWRRFSDLSQHERSAIHSSLALRQPRRTCWRLRRPRARHPPRPASGPPLACPQKLSGASMSIAVTLNGADNVGKTTNAQWLLSALPDAIFAGTVDRWDRRWAKVSRGDFSRWWFVDSTTAEHRRPHVSSHAARREGWRAADVGGSGLADACRNLCGDGSGQGRDPPSLMRWPTWRPWRAATRPRPDERYMSCCATPTSRPARRVTPWLVTGFRPQIGYVRISEAVG
ncbi:DUF4254 domain-containing protein [Salinispora arenicola]|nr:DUF4254 domain-containing protein [Salinispora arenicola]